MITLMTPEISKSDFDKIVRYLKDAGKFYQQSPSSRCRNRARLIKLLVNKITANNRHNKPHNNEQTPARQRACNI